MAIERVNSRLRHWFARFRRRTCVVSKALEMVDATIALFAAYHLESNSDKTHLATICLIPSTQQRLHLQGRSKNMADGVEVGYRPRPAHL